MWCVTFLNLSLLSWSFQRPLKAFISIELIHFCVVMCHCWCSSHDCA